MAQWHVHLVIHKLKWQKKLGKLLQGAIQIDLKLKFNIDNNVINNKKNININMVRCQRSVEATCQYPTLH